MQPAENDMDGKFADRVAQSAWVTFVARLALPILAWLGVQVWSSTQQGLADIKKEQKEYAERTDKRFEALTEATIQLNQKLLEMRVLQLSIDNLNIRLNNQEKHLEKGDDTLEGIKRQLYSLPRTPMQPNELDNARQKWQKP